MYQNVISSGHDKEDWFNAYDNELEGKADSDAILDDKVLCYKGRLWVPDSMDCRKMCLRKEHNSNVGGHLGEERTIELVQRIIQWPQMDQWIEDFVY